LSDQRRRSRPRISRLQDGLRHKGAAAGEREVSVVPTHPQRARRSRYQKQLLRATRPAAAGPDRAVVRRNALRAPRGTALALQGADLAGVERGSAGPVTAVSRKQVWHCSALASRGYHVERK